MLTLERNHLRDFLGWQVIGGKATIFEHPPENKAEELARRDRLYLELAKLLRQSKG